MGTVWPQEAKKAETRCNSQYQGSQQGCRRHKEKATHRSAAE